MTSIDDKISFLMELEKLKGVLRKTKPVGLDRFENSAEHSWQVAMAALLFLPDGVDGLKVLKMMLIHDIVEIDAGDVFVYDEQARKDAEVLEQAAAERIFGLLPAEQGQELLDLWNEFEERKTPEAIFAKAMDRVIPVIQNLRTRESSWKAHGITRAQVIAKNSEIENASPELWSKLRMQIEEMPFLEDAE